MLMKLTSACTSIADEQPWSSRMTATRTRWRNAASQACRYRPHQTRRKMRRKQMHATRKRQISLRRRRRRRRRRKRRKWRKRRWVP